MDLDKPVDSADSRERILAQARLLFAVRGYRGLSMREIAQAVGISKAGIYYHFRDKEDLFAAVVHDYLRQMARLMDDARQVETSARRQLEQIVRALLRQPVEDRSLVRLASQEMAQLSAPVRSSFETAYEELFLGRLRGVIADGMALGELRPVDPQTATWALLGMMYPYFTAGDSAQAQDPPAAVIADLLTLYFDGLSNPGTPD